MALVGVGCTRDAPIATPEELKDPASCAQCHPDQVRDWSGSMHAYSSTDPVFRAMNARGQRETGGALGDFCIQCHAPLAVADGASTDGLDLDTLPAWQTSVSCYFCHQVEGVAGTHNNPLELASDRTMRGSIADPVDAGFHRSRYSRLHDRNRTESSDMCGSCHDVVLDNGLHLEQTYVEYLGSIFNKTELGGRLTCNTCHMPVSLDGRPSVVSPTDRLYHSHAFPGVDVALTPFPERETQRALVQQELDSSIRSELCVYPRSEGGADVIVTLENVGAGHSWPSGAAHDRRAWLELIASDPGGEVLWSVGQIADDEPVDPHVEAPGSELWFFHELAYQADGAKAHMFWEVDRKESHVLQAMTTLDPSAPEWIDPHPLRSWFVPVTPDRIDLAIKIRPIALEVLDDLVDSGDLDVAVRDAMPTFSLAGPAIRWTADGPSCVP